MTESLQTQIDKVRNSIAKLESQRDILGDETVNTALAALQSQLSFLEQQAATLAQPVEERRMVTILFADIVGSTSIAEKLDPEEWRHVVSTVHAALGEAITAHHGSIAQYLGDGILAFFGSRETSEHDPENAIRAALEGHTAIANLHLAEKIQVRTGIHTGLVVVGDLGTEIHKEFTASGDAMNLAARLQSAAPPGGTLISHDTYRYVRGVFDMTPNPPLSVKGKGEPLHTYLVRRAKPRPFRSVARGVAGIETRTIGRETETQLLRNSYIDAYEKHTVVWAQLLGDPGVGKSRVVEDFTDWLDLRIETSRILRGRAFPDDSSQPFTLIRRLWFDRFQIAEDTPLELAEARWVERFAEFFGQEGCDEEAHALGLLVGLSFEGSPYIKGMRNDPAQVKGRAFVVSHELIRKIRHDSPVVVLLEDLQWADPASWEYLTDVFLGNGTGSQLNGLFILGAARPEWQPPEKLSAQFKSTLPEKPEATQAVLINLEPLSAQSTRELAQELLQRLSDVPQPIVELLVERSEGVPYYTEEIVNWLIDHEIIDTHGPQWRFYPERLKAQPLPATLQHLLLTRLSSLSSGERATLQRGSIFGRRFWTGGVEALGAISGDETLGHLQPRGFVDSQPDSAFQGDTEWSFHHNLLQEVTYESVLKRERAALHKVAANWLEQQARQAGRLDEFAGLLGDHNERAGELNAAADWYLLAGKRAMEQGAPRQAREFYAHCLDLLPPADKERRWKALLGQEDALAVLGDAEPWKAGSDALLDLAKSFEDENHLAEACIRQVICKQRSGNVPWHDVKASAQEALDVAQRCGNEAIEAKALAVLAAVYSTLGDRERCKENIEKSLQLARHLENEQVMAFVLFRAAYVNLSTFAEGFQFLSEQIELEHNMGNRLGEANGLGNMASIYIVLGMFKQARPLLEQARKINESFGARRSLAYNLINLGSIYHDTGDLRNAYPLYKQALQEITPSQDARGKMAILYHLGNLLIDMGDIPNALNYFNEMRDIAIKVGTDARVYEAEAGMAICALQQGQLEEARKYIHRIWDYIQAHEFRGIGNPDRFYVNCAETLDALGEADTYRKFLEKVHKSYLEMVGRIKRPEWIQSFNQYNPNVRKLIEMLERLGIE